MLKPREAILPNGKSLYKAGVPYACSESRGPWSCARFMDDGATYEPGPLPPTFPPEVPKELLAIPLSLVVNGTTTNFVVDASVTKAIVYRAGNAELQVTQYPKAVRYRMRYRVKASEKIDLLAVSLPAGGFGSRYNTRRNGEWDGRVCAKLPSGNQLQVLVCDAREKYPRGYKFDGPNLLLILHENLEDKDTSKAGVVDLRAMITGQFSTALPEPYAALLTNDPDVKQAAQEVSASEQAARVSDTYLSLEFWLSIGEPIEPQAPLVLLDGYESPIWWKPKPGIKHVGLPQAEARLLTLASRKLADGPRGSLLYGDFPEQPNSWNRVRFGAGHYFVATSAWRSLLRTGNGQWYALARAFSNFLRDSTWLDGWQDHMKGLWRCGPLSTNGHHVDSEALLFAWLCDGDYASLAEYQKWLAAFTPPTTNNRESVVACRMCRVAHWYTGDAKWKTIADGIEARITAEVERVKATDAYQKFGVGLPTGVNWHPLAFKNPLEIDGIQPEGILAARKLAKHQQLDQAAGFILYGMPAKEGSEIGFGPLGEGHVGLQMEAITVAYRARELKAKRRAVYATSKDSFVRVWIEKLNDGPDQITVRLFGRTPGDYHPQKVFLFDPNGIAVELTAGITFPAYVDSGSGWVLDKQFVGWIDGMPCVQKTFKIDSKAGRYQVAVYGYRPQVFAGISSYCEWQEVVKDEVQYPGIDSEGNPVIEGILVGTQ